MHNHTETEEDFVSQLKTTNKLLRRMTSKRHVFYRGVIGGLGASLGATVVVAALIWLFGQLQYVPYIGTVAKPANEVLQNRITVPFQPR